MVDGGLRMNAFCGIWGNVMLGCGRFFAFVVLAKYFSSVSVGQFMLAWAIVLPLAAVINMEVRMVFVTDTHGNFPAGVCLGIRFLSNVILWGVLVVVSYLLRNYWGPEGRALLMGIGAIKMVESWAEVYLGVLQKHEHMGQVAISQTLKTVLLLFWILLVAHSGLGILLVPMGWTIILILITWGYDRVRSSRLTSVRLAFQWSVARMLAGRAFWLGLFLMLVHLNESVARYFIEFRWGEVGVAYYGMMMIFVTGAVMAQTGLNQSVLPRLAVYYHSVGVVLLSVCWVRL